MTTTMAAVNDVDDDEGSVPGLLTGRQAGNERQEMGSSGWEEGVF